MRDIREIQRAWADEVEAAAQVGGSVEAVSSNPVVLCTLVQTEGSFYRKPGTRMLVTQDGRLYGLISGGCLESDLRDRALKTLARGEPCIVSIDMTSEDDIYFGYSSGCPGKIWVLLEPIVKHLGVEDRDLRLGLVAGGVSAQVLLYEAHDPLLVGRRIRWTEDQMLHGTDGLPKELVSDLKQAFLQKKEGVTTWESSGTRDGSPAFVRYFLECLRRPIHLHLFGAGPDADAVYELTVALGWDISVYDNRQALLDQRRFPVALQLVHSYYEDDWTSPPLDRTSPCVVMTHNLPRDLLLLPKLLASGSAYVGVLGAAKRAALIRDALKEEGFTDGDLTRLRSPVGLDIGARDPWTIALAILAEIQSCMHKLTMGSS